MNTEEKFLDLAPYIKALRRWYRLVLAFGILGALAGLVFSLVQQPVYEAEARVALVRATTAVNLAPNIKTFSDVFDSGLTTDQAARRKAILGLADSPDLANAVIGVMGDKLGTPAPTADALLASVDSLADGDIVRIRAHWPDPATAAEIANEWAKEYERRTNQVYADSPLTLAEVVPQVQLARADYDAAEAALTAFLRVSRGDELQRQITETETVIVSLQAGGARGQTYVDGLVAARYTALSQRAAAKTQHLNDLYSMQTKIDRLLADAAALRTRLSAAAGMSQGELLALTLLEASAFSTWAALPVDLQVQMDAATPPVSAADALRSVDELTAVLAGRRKAVASEIATLSKDLMENAGTESVDAQLQSLEKLTAYAAAGAPVTKVITDLSLRANELQAQLEADRATERELTQARDLAWTTYTALASKASELTVSEQARGSVVRLAAAATPPERRSAPKTTQNIMIALAAGLALGAALVLLRQYADHSFHDKAEGAAGLGLPVLAQVPRSAPKGAPVSASAGSAITEDPAFALLRHHLLARPAPWKVVLAASALPDEGRTTVAAGLAVALARSGRSVIAVDANLHSPTLHDALGIANGDGLADILDEGEGGWEALLRPTSEPGLRLLPAGARRSDPSVLLARPALAGLFSLLRNSADVVVVDGSAVLGRPDCLALAAVSDLALLVVKAGGTQAADAVAAREELEQAGVELAGVALNRTAPVRAGGRMAGRLSRLLGGLAGALRLDAEG